MILSPLVILYNICSESKRKAPDFLATKTLQSMFTQGTLESQLEATCRCIFVFGGCLTQVSGKCKAVKDLHTALLKTEAVCWLAPS